METWDAIRARRNVRSFEDRPIADRDLERILEAGWRAPSSRNGQPWDFVAVTDREHLVELSHTWRGAKHVASSAATVALVVPMTDDPDERDWQLYDLGQATIQMMVAAADLGIGSCHSVVDDHELARRSLDLPAGRDAVALLALGYPADRPLRPIARPDRRPKDDVIHRERW
ncbi:MAG TPA: nitroreductase family protein [Actinomycetota bacterium]|nr:nitroreductase family protein [Actinomycetota bacterium]